ncbi:MAG TPA: hypothetical protein VMV69_11855 [Pirellulales bacterium]|nr:hypothetical protein [Pirellulales bacterium]
MFLVEYPRFGGIDLVFTWSDPRKEEYVGDVIEGVSLDYDMAAVHAWPDGEPAPDVCAGRSPDDRKHYKVFRYTSDCLAVGYEPVPGTPFVFGPWSDYMRLHLSPPHPNKVDEEDWYNYLDKVDEVARLYGRRPVEASMPKSGDRDDVAAWVAKSHFVVDTSIREVWYLPQGAPPDEIRLLELNDRVVGNETTVEPMDFGLDLEGAPYRLLVADVSSDQFEQIKCDPGRLPPGWFLDGGKNWRRRGA